MKKEKLIGIATRYLNGQEIDFVGPIELGRKEGRIQEVIFWHPLTKDPEVATVDPPDIIVLVDLDTGEADLKYQM